MAGHPPVIVRPAAAQDIPALDAVAQASGSRHAGDYFQRCLAERAVFMAAGEEDGSCAGYVQLNPASAYVGFRRLGLPEVQDLVVAPFARGRGIGAALLARCEEEALARGMPGLGVSVGLYHSYGPAQRLYVTRGYVPDGAGIMQDDEPVRPGSLHAVDDSLTLKMVKFFS